MNSFTDALRGSAILLAATLGAGIFALPYLFLQLGFFAAFLYLAALGAVIIFAHSIYWRTLDSARDDGRLLTLARRYLGNFGYIFGIIVVSTGLLFTLVVYLILGAGFIRFLLPALQAHTALLLFWAAVAVPFFFSEKKVLKFEGIGAMVVTGIILFIFVRHGALPLLSVAPIHFSAFFFPFGAFLFSLAGWPGVELLRNFSRSHRHFSWKVPLALGTFFAVLLSALFVLGVWGAATHVTPDTISGFNSGFDGVLLVLLGLFCLVVVYEPVSLEIKNAFIYDLRIPRRLSAGFVALLPLVLVVAGFDSFLRVVGLVGGFFLSMQYLLILFVGRRALRLSSFEHIVLNLATVIFILGAVYEVSYFVIG